METRLATGPWLALWCVITALQLAPLAVVDPSTLTGAPMLAVLVLEAILVLAKAAIAVPRLFDQGRAPDDAVLVLVPIVNVAIFFRLIEKAPKEEIREKRLASWRGNVSALEAFTQGVGLYLKGAPIFLPLAVLWGAAYWVANIGASRLTNFALEAVPPSKPASMLTAPELIALERSVTADNLAQGLFILAAATGAYGLFQLTKASRASRASWLPALISLPALLFAGALYGRSNHDLAMMVVSLPYEALDLVWLTFVGGLFATIYLSVGIQLRKGKSLSEAWTLAQVEVKKAAASVIAVHGGVQLAIFLGMQVVLPGIHFFIAYAFTDHSVLLNPEKPAFTHSGRVASGLRRRIFVTQLLPAVVFWFVPSMLLTLWQADFNPGAVMNSFLDAREVAPWTQAIGMVFWTIAVAILKLGLLPIYERRTLTLADAKG